MRSIVLMLVCVGIVLLAACSVEPNAESPTPAEAPQEEAMAENSLLPLLSGMHTVILKTSKGNITLELNADAAPKTVTNFVQHAAEGYYDGLNFHRVIADFMIQGGDPNGNGSGGDSVFGETFEDEINAKSYKLDTIKISDVSTPDQLATLPEEMQEWTLQQFYESQGYQYNDALESLPMVRGAIAMANRGPNTNGSQFFILHTNETPWLEGKHTVFGNVIEGMDVVDAIATADADENGVPAEPVTFTMEVVE